MTYLDALNLFFSDTGDLSPMAQLLYLHLLHVNNRHNNRGSFRITERELASEMKASKTSISRGKAELQAAGLITCNSVRNTATKFAITAFTNGPTADQQRTNGGPTADHQTRARKTKTKTKTSGGNEDEGRFDHRQEDTRWLDISITNGTQTVTST